ncbi:RNA-binding domain-containing protein [Rozella allomycis CSF55]|uniref:RNA recognition motif domain-containing protein n=1 Tax=Rozella allomycis (strain CSF55) TaxID=988480 RepID=A0A075B1G1_ROZAC|nr:RNA recognition motif domain-containing protein [Rozella allomycis CSF55]RKP18607.1 RNA-binding domain-containing protein [Rozella allomycis CSF55]|eukprot:EPZ36383.1 RNA recognition motif domain-containing protein [Rozella allomycis CSF55]
MAEKRMPKKDTSPTRSQREPSPARSTHSAQSASDKEGRKIFVGNLDFQTTNIELKEFFATEGKVLKAHIITRGTLSRGYGFVTFEKAEEAERAVEKLNQTELNGRKINCEIAIPREHHNESNARGRGRLGRRGRGRGRGRGGFRGGRRFSKRRIAQGEPSTDMVFVTNIPYSVDEDELTNHFKGLSVSEVTIPRNSHNQRSRGFAFVTFSKAEDQKKAVEKFDQTEIEGRSLKVRIAKERPKEDSKTGEADE